MGSIIAISFYPLQKRLTKLLSGKKNMAATLLTLVMVVILLMPIIMFTNAIVDNLMNVAREIKSGTMQIPTLGDMGNKVKEWSSVGKPIYEVWTLASKNVEAVFKKFSPKMHQFGSWLFSSLTGLVGSVFIFLISLTISGILLPIIIYMFTMSPNTTAIIFTAYEVISGASDNVLKP